MTAGSGRNSGPDLTSRAALGFLRCALPDLEVSETLGAVLERGTAADPPRLSRAECLEHPEMRAVPVAPISAKRESAFAGFLDGTQKLQVVAYPRGLPVVLGTVSAAIRFRENRRLITWKGLAPAVERRLYVPMRQLGFLNSLTNRPFPIVDVSAQEASGGDEDSHPLRLIDCAMHLLQTHRESLEARFAVEWCRRETAPLFVDGGISGNPEIAASPLAIGIVKSHRTLYADSKALGLISGLGKAERSSVFRIASDARSSVASWYLRLRSTPGQDPLWGLVRIEIADTQDAAARADEVSRWVLSESSPLSLPDGRWDKMAYGVRATEEFLRAIS